MCKIVESADRIALPNFRQKVIEMISDAKKVPLAAYDIF